MTKALRKIDLEKCEKIGSGGHGAIYRVSEDEIVKVNFNPETFQNLEAELNIAKEAFLLGVPTAISFDIVDCGEGRRGIVYEIMKSKTLGEVIQSNPERMEEYADEYIRQLNNLHSIHTDNPIFGRAKDQYYKQLEGASKYLTEEEVMLLKKVVDALPDGDRLVHSDAHPKNIMIQNGEMMWIDMEMVSVGHPIYDIISIAVMIMGMPTEEMAIRLSGMNLENLSRLKSYFIRKYFKTEDPEMIARLEAVMNSLRLIRTVFSIGIDTVNVKDHRQGIVNLAREVFFPNVDRIIGGIRMMTSMIS